MKIDFDISRTVEIRHDRQKGFYCSGTEFNMKYISFFVSTVVEYIMDFCGYEMYIWIETYRREEGNSKLISHKLGIKLQVAFEKGVSAINVLI